MKNKKTSILILTSVLTLGITTTTNAQVVIGGETGAAGSNTGAVLLDFPTTQKKGIILPYVTTLPSTPTRGTILVDATDPTKAKVKYYNGTWQDLSSGNEANLNQFAVSGGGTVDVMGQQPSTTEDLTSKAIIGANTSAADGVLVLESTNKAMVLPRVANTNEVTDPAPGMMVYITGANKRLAVFNGAKWTFWAPAP